MSFDLILLIVSVGATAFGVAINYPLQKLSQRKRARFFSPVYVDKYHFEATPQQYGMKYVGSIADVATTIFVQPRARYGPLYGRGASYAGDSVQIYCSFATGTRAVVSRGTPAGKNIGDALDKKYSKKVIQDVSVSQEFFPGVSAKAIDENWFTSVLSHTSQLSDLLPKSARGVASVQIIPDIVTVRFTSALADVTPELLTAQMEALKQFVETLKSEKATVTDTTTAMEKNWVVNFEQAQRNARRFMIGCLVIFLLGFYALVKFLMMIEGAN